MGTKALLIALVTAASASLCAANEYGSNDSSSSQPAYFVTIGQGGYMRLPDLRPAPASYALTGEQTQYRQTQRVWEAQAGVSYNVGNGRIVIPQSR